MGGYTGGQGQGYTGGQGQGYTGGQGQEIRSFLGWAQQGSQSDSGVPHSYSIATRGGYHYIEAWVPDLGGVAEGSG